MKRTGDNHFSLNGVGKIGFPLKARMTSIAGETVGGEIKKMENKIFQDSGVQYKGFKAGNS